MTLPSVVACVTAQVHRSINNTDWLKRYCYSHIWVCVCGTVWLPRSLPEICLPTFSCLYILRIYFFVCIAINKHINIL